MGLSKLSIDYLYAIITKYVNTSQSQHLFPIHVNMSE